MEAQAGRPVTEGATTELNGTGSLMPDAPHLRALIWMRAQLPLPGVMLPQGRYLMGVFVHAHELAVAKAHGVTRLLSMLGSAA